MSDLQSRVIHARLTSMTDEQIMEEMKALATVKPLWTAGLLMEASIRMNHLIKIKADAERRPPLPKVKVIHLAYWVGDPRFEQQEMCYCGQRSHNARQTRTIAEVTCAKCHEKMNKVMPVDYEE